MDLKELASQLKKPEGETGRQVGEMMNKGNLLLNNWSIDALQLKKGDKVLEIGMGNGYFVKDILSVDPSIIYHGIDYSPLMREEAEKMNSSYLLKGNLFFETGDAASLPYNDESFTAVLTVNTIYFWKDAGRELREIFRVLKKEGRLVIGIRSKKAMQQLPFTEYGFIKYGPEELSALVAKHGFRVSELVVRNEPPYDFNGEVMELENIVLSCMKDQRILP